MSSLLANPPEQATGIIYQCLFHPARSVVRIIYQNQPGNLPRNSEILGRTLAAVTELASLGGCQFEKPA